MGASFNDVIVKGTKDEVKAKFAEIQERDRYENGHSYSGGFGMAHGLVFDRLNRVHTEQEAYDWLCDNTSKWGPAVAIRLDGDQWMIGAWCSS